MITTKDDLINLFLRLGLRENDDVFVHSSLSSLGYVVNGPSDVIEALFEVVGWKKGTVLMPAHTGQLTDPSEWIKPQLDKKNVDIVKANMRPLNLKLTPVRNRGLVAQSFLNYPGVTRSNHPLNSVSALGKRADFYLSSHSFDEPEGLDSPIGKLYENNGKVLGIGVGVSSFTAIHLAEFLADLDYLNVDNPTVLFKRENEQNTFRTIKKYPGSSEKFTNILPLLREKKIITELKFNENVMTCLSIKPVIECVVDTLKKNPLFLIS